MTDIGRVQSLGLEADLADAETIRAVAAGLAASPRTGTVRVVMVKAIWHLWEHPRLPRPLVSGKYPRSYPWSPAARAAAQGERPTGGYGLIIEHAVPQTLNVTRLLEGAAQRETQEVLEILTAGSRAAVVTRADDALLTAAGLRERMPAGAGSDPWARYRAAGLDPDEFAPLDPP